jgi:hypothetical protein
MTQTIWYPHGNPNLVKRFLARLCEERDAGRINLYRDEIGGRPCYVIEPIQADPDPKIERILIKMPALRNTSAGLALAEQMATDPELEVRFFCG